MEQLGIVTPPKKEGFPPELLARKKAILTHAKEKPAILKALLEERRSWKFNRP